MITNDYHHQHAIEQLRQRADHLAQAGEPIRAARFYRLAAEEAASIWANEDALTFVSRALKLTPDSSTSGRFQLLLLREELYGRLGQIEQQEVDLVSLSTLAHYLNDDRLRARVAARLGEYKLARGEFQDVISIVNLALRLAEMAGAQQEAAVLHLLWGRALHRLDKYVEAHSQLEQGLALAQDGGWTRETADGRRFLGVLALETNDIARARAHYEKALPLYRQLKDRRGEGDLLNNLGNLAHAQGRLGEALAFWDKAHTIYLMISDRTGSCRLLINQSTACMDMGLYDRARTYFKEALAISREINLAFGEALALINLALIEHYTDQQQNAFDTVQDALRAARQMGSNRLEGYALGALGKILTSLGDLEAAADTFWEALAIWQDLDQPNLAYEARAGLGKVALEDGNPIAAFAHIQPLVEHLENGGNFEGTESPMAMIVICIELLLANGAEARAERLLRQAHEIIQTQVGGFQDEEAKTSYLEEMVSNKALLALDEARNAEPAAVASD